MFYFKDREKENLIPSSFISKSPETALIVVSGDHKKISLDKNGCLHIDIYNLPRVFNMFKDWCSSSKIDFNAMKIEMINDLEVLGVS
jgi:hypothetical protein